MNFKNFTGETLKNDMKELIEVDIDYFNDIYDNSILTTYLNKLRDYQITLKQYHSVHYDINYNVDKFLQPIGIIYDKFIKTEISFGMNYKSLHGIYHTYPPYYDHMDMYEEQRDNIVKESKKELLELKAKVIKLKNDLYQLGTYLKEYLKEDIIQKLTIVDKNRSPINLDNFMDINVEFNSNEDKKYAIRKRHKNKLLEA